MKWLLAPMLLLAPLSPLTFAVEPAKPAAKPEEAKDIWLHDYKEAVKIATKEKKPILMLFTGSDWCKYCKILEKNVLSTPEFQTWAKKNVVLFIADFPQRKVLPAAEAEQNNKLAEEFKIKGYPSVLLADSQGKLKGVAKFNPSGTPAEFIKVMEAVKKGKKQK